YWWAVVAALMVATYPFETGLFVMKLPERLILGRCLAAAVSIGLALLLVPRLGAHGAMIAAAAGWAIALGASVLRLPRALRCRAGQGAA
ncbi:MAG: polysaccharide biosynthesis C-terminal domain-containing protein, partial [Minwuiales bacterium]|nr:polysaccharide biosynthesis C-terminal domain-containing protein [Minwuiales bacterium]